MTSQSTLLKLVDTRDLRRLFIEELGWANPDRPPQQLTVDGHTFTLDQVAGYKGLRIWHCAEIPDRRTQRTLDTLIGNDNHERLVLFTNETRQEWRWPRRAQTSGVNAKLLVHPHTVGAPNENLAKRLQTIAIDFDEDVSLVDLLARMRRAFDAESETASVQAARLMGTLYTELESSKVGEHEATLLLARLLFLLFADDTSMWKSQPDLFKGFLAKDTSAPTLHADLVRLFEVLNTDERYRDLPSGSPFAVFRYVNGGLFADRLALPPLSPRFRDGLLEACEFNWALISPAVFGSMFQTVRDKEARRAGGEHYTTEENILKTIRPLFLDEFSDRLDAAWDDKAQLTKLHTDLGKVRVLDPACGCGNFLIVAFRELRALELQVLIRRRDLDTASGIHTGGVNRSQMTLDVTGDVKVTLDHFSGIEIDDWPARIAQTAMLLMDHLANQNMEEEFGLAPDRLPIKIAARIYCRNALRIDWSTVVPATEDVIVVGNPPFIGQYTKTAEQTADTKAIWGSRWNGYLDYVTCWYAKALDYYGDLRGRWAFVSTNSICQGEPVEFLWRPILEAGWRCRFAHRSFQWLTEAREGAAVHVSIVGFDQATSPRPVLWTYPEGGKGEGTPQTAARVNPYLCDGPNVLVSSQTTPLSPELPQVTYGNKPTDDGNLFVSPDERAKVEADPIAAKYLRPFVGARELLHDNPRWCLWLEGATQEEINTSHVLRGRVASVREMRMNSPKDATRKKAATPHLFDERRQPSTSYLGIPAHVGEHRRYFTAARYDSDVICGNANFMVADPDGFALGILSSSMFITWMRAVGGRLKSDLRFSNTFTYNSFPLPNLTVGQRENIVRGAGLVAAARASHPGNSLATLYEPGRVPADLTAAHDELDMVIDDIFGCPDGDIRTRQRILFQRYANATGQPTR